MTHKTRWPMQLGLAIAITSAASGLAGCKSSASARDPRTETKLVEIARVAPAVAQERGFTGIVRARVQSDLTFRVPGKIIERLVDTGQQVRQGEPLMRIDRTDYAHAIAVQVGNVAAARARLTQAAADEERYRQLVSSGAVSRSAFDEAKAAADSARALLRSATAALKVAQDEGRYSTLVADADGTIIETLAEPGQYVAAGQVVLKLAHSGPREASIDLPETLRPAIGSRAEAILYGSAAPVPVHLRQLSDAADPLTRTFEARYVLEGPAAQAPLGATITVYLSASPLSADMSVPLGAIDDEGRGPGVWIYDAAASSVSFRPVHVVQLADEAAIVKSGVHVGEPIVALGGHFLYEGKHVRVTRYEADLR
ncbi:MAG TPA: efflux RND transporter periplasmic adaptor subunit [Steroidobacteraceae bacterium]|nr:efflux RND transporter periplasmic adaptor subunit [Steroidobacteraceae bacterium]